MEETVALDSSKQKEFVKGIKKLLKKKDKKNTENKDREKTKDGKIIKRKKAQRGLVYLSHIPHGFYEHQMSQYFKQFGVVTNVRVIRSKHTGNSKGYAFVEFKDPAVAEIVAETMNNYLMGKRLLKAEIVPPEKQKKFALRMNWNNQSNPGQVARLKMKNKLNAHKTESEELKIAKKLLAGFSKTKKRLAEYGIDYDFFAPVDVPEGLQIKAEVTVTDDVKSELKEKVMKKKAELVEQKVENITKKKSEQKVKKNEYVMKKKPERKVLKTEKTMKKKPEQKVLNVESVMKKKPEQKVLKMENVMKKKPEQKVLKMEGVMKKKPEQKLEMIEQVVKKKAKIDVKVAKDIIKKTNKPQSLRVKRKNK